MKKKYLSGLVILITVILVAYMIVNDEKEDSGYTMVKQESESISEIESEDLNRLLEIIENKEKHIVEKKNDIAKEEVKSREEVKNNKKEENKSEEKLKTEELPTTEKFQVEEEVAVFKIDKNLIAGSLSFAEKKNLAKIVSTLSMNDYALIIESIKNDGELECVIEVNQILRERLDEKEYNLIKEILEPYINLDVL